MYVNLFFANVCIIGVSCLADTPFHSKHVWNDELHASHEGHQTELQRPGKGEENGVS